MNFIKDYPNLFQFFGGYFPDADFDNLTDEEAVANYVTGCTVEELKKTKKELCALTEDIDNYWEEVRDESNRYFDNSQDSLVKYD